MSHGVGTSAKGLIKRRVTYFDIVKMQNKERGVDEETFDRFVAANPVVAEMSSFMNSLLFEIYDDTPGKLSWFSFARGCALIGHKTPFLFWKFFRNLTIPQETPPAQSGGQGIRTLNRSPGN